MILTLGLLVRSSSCTLENIYTLHTNGWESEAHLYDTRVSRPRVARHTVHEHCHCHSASAPHWCSHRTRAGLCKWPLDTHTALRVYSLLAFLVLVNIFIFGINLQADWATLVHSSLRVIFAMQAKRLPCSCGEGKKKDNDVIPFSSLSIESFIQSVGVCLLELERLVNRNSASNKQ